MLNDLEPITHDEFTGRAYFMLAVLILLGITGAVVGLVLFLI